MHKLVVLYPEPTDRAAFRAYYESVHLPLAQQLAGVVSMTYSLDLAAPDGELPYFGMFEAVFESPQAMGAALESPEGAALAADLPNYATGGAHLMHMPVAPVGGVDPRAVILEYLERWNQHDVSGIVAMMAPDGEYTDPSLPAAVSGSDLEQHLSGLFAAVPHLHLDVIGAAADGPSTAVAFWRMTGTVDFPGGNATGHYDLHGSDIIRVDQRGAITWTAALYDQVAFLTQSGVPLDTLHEQSAE